MSEWIYFIHAPRERFAETMTDEEQRIWGEHAALLERRLAAGTLVLAGPTLGPTNTGICIFEAPDEDAARAYMAEDPAIATGAATGELRPFRVSFCAAETDAAMTRRGMTVVESFGGVDSNSNAHGLAFGLWALRFASAHDARQVAWRSSSIASPKLRNR